MLCYAKNSCNFKKIRFAKKKGQNGEGWVGLMVTVSCWASKHLNSTDRTECTELSYYMAFYMYNIMYVFTEGWTVTFTCLSNTCMSWISWKSINLRATGEHCKKMQLLSFLLQGNGDVYLDISTEFKRWWLLLLNTHNQVGLNNNVTCIYFSSHLEEIQEQQLQLSSRY